MKLLEKDNFSNKRLRMLKTEAGPTTSVPYILLNKLRAVIKLSFISQLTLNLLIKGFFSLQLCQLLTGHTVLSASIPDLDPIPTWLNVFTSECLNT